jgi:hypothetical protein
MLTASVTRRYSVSSSTNTQAEYLLEVNIQAVHNAAVSFLMAVNTTVESEAVLFRQSLSNNRTAESHLNSAYLPIFGFDTRTVQNAVLQYLDLVGDVVVEGISMYAQLVRVDFQVRARLGGLKLLLVHSTPC